MYHPPDINPSFVLHPHQGGVKLLQPEETLALPTLQEISNRQMNCFFLRSDHVILDVNDVQLNAFNLASKEEMIGADLSKFSNNKEHIQKIHLNNTNVMQNKRLSVCDEDVDLADESEILGVSVKMPWYDDENKVIGIFGFSHIFKDNQHFTKSLDFADTLNFFMLQDTAVEKSFSKKIINGVYFTDRELTIMKYVMQGKTLREIATMQSRSIRTIETHLVKIKFKMRVKTKSALIQALYPYF